MPTGKSTSNTNTPSKAGGTNTGSSNRGSAAMDGNKQREIANQGGKTAHEKGTAHEFDSEKAREAGRKERWTSSWVSRKQ